MEFLIILIVIVFVILGWLLLLAGAGICINDKCPPLNISKEETETLKLFDKFFNNLTEEEQNEYLEKIKNPAYHDSYTPYIRDVWDSSSNSKSNCKDVSTACCFCSYKKKNKEYKKESTHGTLLGII